MTTSEKAEIAMLQVQLNALKKGIVCNKPIQEGTRYDLILDEDNQLRRIQVKFKKNVKDGVILLNLWNNNGANKPYETKEIDDIIIYVEELNKLYRLPLHVFGEKVGSISLRIKPPKTNRKVWMASNFEW